MFEIRTAKPIIKSLFLFSPTFLWLIIVLLKDYYLIEVIRSFWPYLAGIQSVHSFFLFLLWWKDRESKEYSISFVLSLILLAFSILPLADFYSTSSQGSLGGNDNISLLVSNVWWRNDEYRSMTQEFLRIDADILVLIEFTEEQYKNMEEDLTQNYPYQEISLENLAKGYVGKGVFSKYPIESVEIIEESSGANTFNKFQISVSEGEELVVYAVHTSSPVTKEFFDMRNQQFELLDDILVSDESDKVIATGDYNLSPWSSIYKRFESVVGQRYSNISNVGGIKFSWEANFAPFAYSHIDHSFIGNGLRVQEYYLVDIPGSDHRAQFMILDF